MKKIIFCFSCLLTILFLTGCNEGYVANELLIEIGESEKFSKEEIENSIEKVKNNFSFPGATLKGITYDEEKSNYGIDSYFENGNGATSNIERDNVIILLSSFYVSKFSNNPVLNRGCTYTEYQWILIRDSKEGPWIIDQWGF